MKRLRATVLYILLLVARISVAQISDTLSLTLARADSMFLANNLQLLAGAYNIRASEALIIQARAYPNPIVSAQVNAIDPENDKFFNAGRAGQREFELEQMILIGGKRRTEIALARQNKAIAEAEFADLLRNLRYQLHANLIGLNKDQVILASYDLQLNVLRSLIDSYAEQAARGNIPVKDVIRLKTVYLRISNNRAEVRTHHQEELMMLQTLLGTTAFIKPVVDESLFLSIGLRDLQSLLDLALDNRPDLKTAELLRQQSEINYRLQRQLAIPDITLNAGYDQMGGAFRREGNLGVSMPLPMFNRNKGNVLAASHDVASAKIRWEQTRLEVIAEVTATWQNLINAVSEFQTATALYTSDFNEVFEGINQNFSKRNISILEFVDFFEAYNESLADFQRIRTHLALLAEQINRVTGVAVF